MDQANIVYIYTANTRYWIKLLNMVATRLLVHKSVSQCSGYHVCFTRRRPRVRAPEKPFFSIYNSGSKQIIIQNDKSKIQSLKLHTKINPQKDINFKSLFENGQRDNKSLSLDYWQLFLQRFIRSTSECSGRHICSIASLIHPMIIDGVYHSVN